jgi:serine/threonine protein kinase
MEGAFKRATTPKPKDQLLRDTTIPGSGDAVTSESPVGRGAIVLGELLGEGGEGRVFAVDGDHDRVVKIFDSEHRTRHRNEKLRLLLSHELGSPGIGFPTSVITNGDGEFVGYAMPRAAGKGLQATIMRPARFKRTYPNWTKADLVDVCISFLEKVEYLHSLNILLGDINPKNLMVNENKDVWIIDADSWQLEGYPCPVGTPMFTAPTITGDYAEELRTIEEELFAVATMLFMILITGQFPYARSGADGGDFAALIKEGKFAFQFQEHSDRDQPGGNWKYMWSHLPFPVKRVFWNTFHRDGDRYSRRPTAKEWLRVFREYKQFFGGPDDFDPMSNDVYPTRYRAMSRETPIYECAKCQTSMVGRWHEDRQTFWEPELCAQCYRDLPRCEGCGKPKSPDSLSNGRCWACNRKRDEELDPASLCRECGEPFITYKHARWFTSRDYEIPKSHAAIKELCPPRPPSVTRQRSAPMPSKSRSASSSSPKAASTPPNKSIWTRLVEWWNS